MAAQYVGSTGHISFLDVVSCCIDDRLQRAENVKVSKHYSKSKKLFLKYSLNFFITFYADTAA